MKWTSTAAALCAALTANAASADAPATTITWGGYVKLDVLYSRFSEGEVAQGTSRDFYVPGTIPVESATGEAHSVLDFHAKETRLFIKTATELENGDKLGTHVEFDFIVNQGAGTEVVTNAYNPGLRRAFVTYNKWTLGQDWSTFQNLGALPETLDFVAFPTDGTVFMRQPVVRYTYGALQLALENNEATVQNGTVAATSDGKVPDVVARADFGGFAVAALVRQLTVDNDDNPATVPDETFDDSEIGWGVSVSGKVPVGADDIRFMVTSGEGIGRYVAIGTSADAVSNVAAGTIEAIPVTNGYVAYRHAWSEQWRSTVTYSQLSVDNDMNLFAVVPTKGVQSFSVNLLYSPAPKVTTGVELRHATRETEAGAEGDLDRLQFSMKYAF